ncbi:MAG TPA: hypothetical protein VEK06_04725, partial [Myxococcota bacterium]|nr:hypothetical protein [Myxococcota bacterium]
MRQFYMRKFALIFGVFLLLSGCKTGLNFAALSLGPEDIKDYGAMAKENSVAPGTATYGVLPSGIESSSAVKLTRDTDLIRFMRLLSTNKTVVLTEDEASEEFIKALSVAIINNRAEPYGLKAHYVYGFNAENFSKSKKLFGMQDSEYQSYVESMAKKAHAQKSEDDKLAIIFVVFIDDFGANLDLSEFIKNLSLGQSRVVLVTKNLSAFKDTSTFISQGIDLMSSYYVAKATIKAINPQIDTNLAIEPLIKMYYGLKSRPEQMNLVSLQRAVKEMLLRLSKKSAAAALPDYEIAAKETLAALEEKIPVEIAEDSTVLVTTLVDVEKHVLANPFYFLDKCKSKNDEFQDEMRKTRLQNEKLTETGAESNERKAKKHYLESIYIGYRGKLENAPP